MRVTRSKAGDSDCAETCENTNMLNKSKQYFIFNFVGVLSNISKKYPRLQIKNAQ